jgi:hypothetical protein
MLDRWPRKVKEDTDEIGNEFARIWVMKPNVTFVAALQTTLALYFTIFQRQSKETAKY